MYSSSSKALNVSDFAGSYTTVFLQLEKDFCKDFFDVIHDKEKQTINKEGMLNFFNDFTALKLDESEKLNN